MLTAPRTITRTDVRLARKKYLEGEPRNLSYKHARELIRLVRGGHSKLPLGEVVADFIHRWNFRVYLTKKIVFNEAHVRDIVALVDAQKGPLARCRKKRIEDLTHADRPLVHDLFRAFAKVLGTVGAAKALHLLRPRLFPLWDTKIAKAYGLAFSLRRPKTDLYWDFMLISRSQAKALREEKYEGRVLKAIDEVNYCRHTKKWIDRPSAPTLRRMPSTTTGSPSSVVRARESPCASRGRPSGQGYSLS